MPNPNEAFPTWNIPAPSTPAGPPTYVPPTPTRTGDAIPSRPPNTSNPNQTNTPKRNG